jgi:PAS domain S-box-containing protein
MTRTLASIVQRPGESTLARARERHKDGSWRWLEGMATNLLDEPSIGAIVVNLRDITERVQAEAALEKTNNLLSRAEQLGRIGSWQWDSTADVATWSNGSYQIFGLSPQQFGGSFQAYLDCVHPDERDRVRRTIEAAYQNQSPLEYETRVVRPDGQVRTLYARAEVIRGPQGIPTGLMGSTSARQWRKLPGSVRKWAT